MGEMITNHAVGDVHRGNDHLPTVIFQVLRVMVQKSCAS